MPVRFSSNAFAETIVLESAKRAGILLPLHLQPLSARWILPLVLAASASPLNVAQASCVEVVAGRIVCSGNTSTPYWAAPGTRVSVEVEVGATIDTAGAAVRVRGDSSVTVSSGATVTVSGANADGAYNAIYAGGDNSSLTNNGAVATLQDQVDGLEVSGNRNTIVNTGTLRTQGLSAEAMHAFQGGHNIILRNSGTIETSGANARGMIAEGLNNTVVNAGVIATTGAGSEGIRVDGGNPGGPGTPVAATENTTVVNRGTITLSGYTADGIRLIGHNSTITNEGTLTALGLEGRGIKIEGTGNRVDNSGTAQGLGPDGEGIYIISNAGQINLIVNGASGRIIARDEVALRGRDGSEHVENDGLVRTEAAGRAAIDLGAGDDSLLIGASSRIEGLVRAGSGTDIFSLGGSTDATFDAAEIGATVQYREFEQFEKVGTSTWTLRNDNGDTMPWAVREGALLVTGNMAGSAMTVHGSATLGGTGTLGSIDALAGSILSPGLIVTRGRGEVGDIATLNVRGDVTIDAVTTYRVDLDNRFRSDRIVADGKATIRGGTVEVHAAQAVYQPGKWTVLTARQGVTGQFSAVDDLVFFKPVLTKDDTNVYLQLNPSNPGGGGGSGMSDPPPPLQPELTPPVMILHHENLFRGAILCRMHCSATDGAGVVPSLGVIESAPAPRSTDWGLWGKAIGSWGHSDAVASNPAMDWTTGGLVVGLDGGLGTPYRLGIATGYLSTSFDIDAASASGSIDSFHIGAYGSAAFGALTLRGGLAYAHHDIDLSRGFLAGASQGGRSDGSADSLQAFGEVGYTFRLAQGTTLEPFAGLAHVHVSSHDVVENASPFHARGEAASFDTTYSTLGAWLVSTMPTSAGAVTFKGMLGWRHAFGDVRPQADFRIDGITTPFLVVGAPIDRDSLVVEAGLNWQMSEKVTVGLMYDGAISQRAQEHTLRASLSVRF